MAFAPVELGFGLESGLVPGFGKSGQQRPGGSPPIPCPVEALTASISVNCSATSCGGKNKMEGSSSLNVLSVDTRDSQEESLDENGERVCSNSMAYE
jgi:hypothetical protein